MDAILRAGDIHRARAQRIARAAGRHARQIRLPRNHLGRRIPVRPLGLALDRFHARPGKAFAADPDAVAERLAVAEDVIKKGVRRIDDDGAGRFLAGIADDLPFQARIELRFVALVIECRRGGLRSDLGSEKGEERLRACGTA